MDTALARSGQVGSRTAPERFAQVIACIVAMPLADESRRAPPVVLKLVGMSSVRSVIAHPVQVVHCGNPIPRFGHFNPPYLASELDDFDSG